jgi:hypothetical protein
VDVVDPQTWISSSSNLWDFPQGHPLIVKWTEPIWSFDVDHQIHSRDIYNLIWKSNLKFDLNGSMHHPQCVVHDKVYKYLHVALEMHAWDFSQNGHFSE